MYQYTVKWFLDEKCFSLALQWLSAGLVWGLREAGTKIGLGSRRCVRATPVRGTGTTEWAWLGHQSTCCRSDPVRRDRGGRVACRVPPAARPWGVPEPQPCAEEPPRPLPRAACGQRGSSKPLVVHGAAGGSPFARGDTFLWRPQCFLWGQTLSQDLLILALCCERLVLLAHFTDEETAFQKLSSLGCK